MRRMTLATGIAAGRGPRMKVLTTDSAARLLVTTLGDTPQTRVLATQLGSGFAVTSVES